MEIILYTLPNCLNCAELTEMLSTREMEFTKKDMSTAENLTHLRVNGCFLMMAPVLEVNGKFLAYEDAKKFILTRVMP